MSHIKNIKEMLFIFFFLDFEDSETIIYYNIRLLEKNSNIVTIDERSSHGAVFRICTRSESVLQLAYYANQVSIRLEDCVICLIVIHLLYKKKSYVKYLY